MLSLIKKTAIVAFIFGTLVALPTLFNNDTTNVHAKPGQEVETFYYSNAQHTVEVGHRILFCAGGTSMTGKTSIYKVTYTTPCD